MENFYQHTISSPVGFLELKTDGQFLLAVSFVDQMQNHEMNLPEIMKRTIQELAEYFEGKRKTFEIALKPEGTEFQKKVWDEVAKIPFGSTKSYLDIALLAGTSLHTRAVGLANGKNPIPIIIPCHRVIGQNGKLTGYAGGIDRKRWLLQHELHFSEKTNTLF